MKSRYRLLARLLPFCLATLLVHGQVPVDVTVDPQHPGLTIPADFVGLSYEMQRVLADTNGYHYFSPTNQPLIATFKTLGIKNLRVGGNTADRPSLPTPSTADVDQLFAFARAAGVRVIYTLRLNQGTPAAAARMAAYIERHYATQLDCFAIGNEPNLFSTNYDVYLTEWKRYATVITQPSNCPTAKFCGPSVSPGHEKWSARFADDLAATGWLAYISQHDYPGGDARKFATNAPAARERLLAPAMADHYEKFAANFVPAVLTHQLNYRFEEANSFYDGGALDASDTFAAALWALDYQWWWAAHHLHGINFHTGDKVAARDENKPCRYASFWTVTNGYNCHPIAYAEKLFALTSPGELLPVTLSTPATNLNFSAYAVLGSTHKVCITLINRSHDANATNLSVQLHLPGLVNHSSVEIIRLSVEHNDVTAKTGVSLGGGTIGDDARWEGKWTSFQPVANPDGSLTVDVPAANAVALKLHIRS